MPKRENNRNKIPLIDVEKEYHTCDDMTKDYMPHNLYEDTYVIEITITFNPKLHNQATSYAAKKDIVQKLLSWHPITNLVIATEYTKKGAVHYHLSLGSEIEFPEGWAFNTMQAFFRLYGNATVRGVVDREAYGNYMAKEVEKNNLKGHSHYTLYQKIDVSDFDELIKV